MTVTIPIFPHLKKFIEKEYGLPLKPDDHSTLGKMITLSLRGRNTSRITREHNRSPIQWNLTESIEIPISADQRELNPNREKLTRLNVHLNTLFKEHLIVWITALKKMDIKPFTAIGFFRAYYNLNTDEFPVDTAHQHFKRYKKKKFGRFVPNHKNDTHKPVKSSKKKKRTRPHYNNRLLKDNITIL